MTEPEPYTLPVGGGDTPLGRWLWQQHVANVAAANARMLADGVCRNDPGHSAVPAVALWRTGPQPGGNVIPMCWPCAAGHLIAWVLAVPSGDELVPLTMLDSPRRALS